MHRPGATTARADVGAVRGEGQGLSCLPSAPLLGRQSAAQPRPPGPMQAHPEETLPCDAGPRGQPGDRDMGSGVGLSPTPPTTVPSTPGDTVPRSHPPSRPATQTERVVPLNTEEPLVQPWVGFAAGWGGPALWVRTLLAGGAGTHLSRAHLSSDCPPVFPVTSHTLHFPYHGPLCL